MTIIEESFQTFPELVKLCKQGRVQFRDRAIYPMPQSEELGKYAPFPLNPSLPLLRLNEANEWCIPGVDGHDIPYKPRGMRDAAYFDAIASGPKAATAFICYNENDLGHAWLVLHDGLEPSKSVHLYPPPPYGMNYVGTRIGLVALAGLAVAGAMQYYFGSSRLTRLSSQIGNATFWPSVGAGVGTVIFAMKPVEGRLYAEALGEKRWLTGAVGLPCTEVQAGIMHCDIAIDSLLGELRYNVLHHRGENCLTYSEKAALNVGIDVREFLRDLPRKYHDPLKHVGPPMFSDAVRRLAEKCEPVYRMEIGQNGQSAQMEFYCLPYRDAQAVIMHVPGGKKIRHCDVMTPQLDKVLMQLTEQGIRLRGATLYREGEEQLVLPSGLAEGGGWQSRMTAKAQDGLPEVML